MCLSCSTATNLVKFSLVHGETKMEFGIVLIKEGEAEINTNPVNLFLFLSVEDGNGQFPIHDGDQFKRWREDFATVLIRMASSKVGWLMKCHKKSRIEKVD